MAIKKTNTTIKPANYMEITWVDYLMTQAMILTPGQPIMALGRTTGHDYTKPLRCCWNHCGSGPVVCRDDGWLKVQPGKGRDVGSHGPSPAQL